MTVIVKATRRNKKHTCLGAAEITFRYVQLCSIVFTFLKIIIHKLYCSYENENQFKYIEGLPIYDTKNELCQNSFSCLSSTPFKEELSRNLSRAILHEGAQF